MTPPIPSTQTVVIQGGHRITAARKARELAEFINAHKRQRMYRVELPELHPHEGALRLWPTPEGEAAGYDLEEFNTTKHGDRVSTQVGKATAFLRGVRAGERGR